MAVLEINPSVAGISGDMFIAALFDLFEDYTKVVEEIQSHFDDVEVRIKLSLEKKSSDPFYGKYLKIEGNNTISDADDLLRLITLLSEKHLSGKYRGFAIEIVNILLNAEKKVHESDDVHLHELGTIDTIVDSFVPALLLQKLNVSSILIHPVATGTGMSKTAHGLVPVPAPVTVWILQKYQISTLPGPRGEATTPTGASILASLLKNFERPSAIIWRKTGIGFGMRTWEDRANIIRIQLGDNSLETSRICILETNIDDTTGEILGDSLDRLMEKGALDVSFYPIYMKKNRPGYCLRVLTKIDQVNYISSIIMRLTGSLGVRVIPVHRHIGERQVETVKRFIRPLDSEVEFRVKHGSRKKIEFEDLKRLADQFSIEPIKLNQILLESLEDD